MKPTQQLIEAEIALEREAVRAGVERLREQTKTLEKRTYASASVYGISSVHEALPVITEYINKTATKKIKEGACGLAFKEIYHYLTGIEDEVLAAIALKVVFDRVFSYKEENRLLQHICVTIGSAIASEAQMRFYEAEDPKLLENIKRKYWHSSCGTRQRLTVARTLMNRREVRWTPWGTVVNVKLGAWLLECVIQGTGWFTKENRHKGVKQHAYIVPTPEYLQIKNQIELNAEFFAPIAWPMLVQPNDWSNESQGGYLLNEIQRLHRLVRRQSSEYTLPLGEQTLSFVNHLQKTAYSLNPFVVGVAEVLFEQRIQVGKFVPVVELPLPPKPPDIADNADARLEYRRGAAEVMNKNAAIVRRSCRTRMTMNLVKRFKDIDRFYIPWSFDYRGRVYPIPAFLTPQDTDFGKSLIRFADESFMDDVAEGWLAFQVANTYGLDKSTMTERLEWVSNHYQLITNVATKPLDFRSDWESAEEPWQFLAACEEFYACIIACTRQTTGICVAVDATCSGLQILAGLAKDKSTAQLVNVIPGNTPQDAYKAVAERSKELLPENLACLMDRKVTKRTVMTIPYNAKPFSNRQYIKEALKEKGAEYTPDDLTAITRAVIQSMKEMVPGPMKVMAWINEEVRLALERGVEELQWETPSGFVVHQRLMKPNVIRVQTQLLGRCMMNVADGETDLIDKNRHKAATAPNLIHSLDASLLHLAFTRFNAPFAVIHDSVLCRATDMSQLNSVMRETYTDMFAGTEYLKDFAQQIGAINEPPIIGDFDPLAVLESTYFFS